MTALARAAGRIHLARVATMIVCGLARAWEQAVTAPPGGNEDGGGDPHQ